MKVTTSRRRFIKSLLSAGTAVAMPGIALPTFAQSDYSGKFLISLQLDGGVDVTSYCDPKMNVAGEREINHWAIANEVQQAGNISYAPWADNNLFFDKYYKDILVINGVDAQTNAHSVGKMYNWSGRNTDGYPTITALFAANKAPDKPLSYLHFGGFGNTAGIVQSTRIGDLSQLRNLVFPNQSPFNAQQNRLYAPDWERIKAMHANTMHQKALQANVIEGDRINRIQFLDAVERTDAIKAFGELIPDSENIQQKREFYGGSSLLHQQIQVTLLAFKSGVAVASDLFEFNYDTHQEHDAGHEPLLSNTNDAVDYLWTFAEELGIADRIVLVIGSDFGRTPFYNSGNGKDHWPIGSYIVMEKNASYTNQVIGETDEGHNAFALSSNSLSRDDNGIILTPPHVHKALRRYLGLEQSALANRFQLDSFENFNFFG